METVVTINLNGNAYQLDESGYHQLRAYLERAAAQLRDNPDRAEIIADLEQAIAEKCAAHLGPHKSVVTAAEVEEILQQMGPVHDPASDDARAGREKTAGEARDERKAGDRHTSDPAPPKRLYQIREGAMLTGVCNGLAAYFNVDVTLVRIAFVVLAILTKGVWILVYVVMSLVIPFATTAEERAAAHGRPFSAQDMIDQAKANYREFRDGARWRRHRAQWRRQWRRTFGSSGVYVAGGPGVPPEPYATQVWAGLLTPVLAIAQAVLLAVSALAVISLLDDGDIFGWLPPPEVPQWAIVIGLFVGYQILVSPLRSAQMALARQRSGLADASGGLLTMAVSAFFLWLAYQNIPEVREFVHDLPDMFNAMIDSFRDWQRNR